MVLAVVVGAAQATLAAAQQQGQPPAPPVAESRLAFSIPAQDLNGAILAFAAKAGVQVFYDVARVRGLRSNGVSGNMAPKEALGRILAGTGLGYRFTGANTVALENPPANLEAGGAMALPPVQVEASATSGYGPYTGTDRIDNPQQVVSVSKTGTKLENLPQSVQVIPRNLLSQQGATMLRQSVYNASGINVGGQDTKGFYDHFLIRGLNAQIYTDNFSDGDQLGGISHSLNGVERVEILEGPGSALFGSGPPGGTINIIHYTPSPEPHYGALVQGGSFGTIFSTGYATGPTGLTGLNYRVDATAAHSAGFRDLSSHDLEIRPSLEWQVNNHVINVSVDLRQIYETPDPYGLIYFNGSPIRNVPMTSKYSTPFAAAHENLLRPTITDSWNVSDYLVINNRFSYLHRTFTSLGNGDSSSTKVSGNEVIGRQLRDQSDNDNSYQYQLEPVWNFATGTVGHTLLTGFEYQHLTMTTNRSTADLPNIPDTFAPVPPETSVAQLQFQCDARHSCDDDFLVADYYSLYATDQMDITDRLKLRVGARKDWWNTSLTPQITVPGRFATNGQPLIADVTQTRNDAPVSWYAGSLYKLTPWIAPYAGVSKSYLANFNSENTQNGIGSPESAVQFEAGVKAASPDQRFVFNIAAFNVSRNNVAALTTIAGIETVVFDSQRTRGGEISFDAQVTDSWHLLANATRQNAVITNNPQGITSEGNHPQGVPAYIANIWTTYDFSLAGTPGFRIGGGLNYESGSYSDITNVNSIPGFFIINALLGYERSHWGIDLNIHNLTNQRYFLAANGAGALVGDPLSAFVTLHANY